MHFHELEVLQSVGFRFQLPKEEYPDEVWIIVDYTEKHADVYLFEAWCQIGNDAIRGQITYDYVHATKETVFQEIVQAINTDADAIDAINRWIELMRKK